MADSFGHELTLGAEEELMLLDPVTLGLAPGVERLLGPPGVKTELFACLVETNTVVCESAGDLLAELVRLRRLVQSSAEREGLAVAATGTHPFSRPEEQPIVAEPRYLKLLEEFGPNAKRQLVCGLHVHVGMTSFERCLERLDAILPWLPAVLAISANSPYLAGAEASVLSTRAGRLLELPRGGPPPHFATRDEWHAYVAASGEDYTRIWWDARAHPRLGTLEVRIADQPTSVSRAAGIAGLVQALCAAAPPTAPIDRAVYLGERAAGAQGRADVAGLLALVEHESRRLGSWELVEALDGPPEAEDQLEIGRRDGLQALAAELVARSSE